MRYRPASTYAGPQPLLRGIWLGVMMLLVALSTIQPLAAQQFDHDNTFFPLDFVHSRVNCDTCHLQRVFKGTPTRCDGCHGTQGRMRAIAPSARHIPIIEDCHFCHQGLTWQGAVRVDHYAVLGSCQGCHNGVIASGKNANHIQSSENCDNCHRTNHWLNAVFDHSEIVGNCQSCHNGLIATGKPPDHILSGDNCQDCHRTLAWLPVPRVDHGSVIGSCSSCHNNVIAIGQPADHVVTNEECNVCHLTTNWTTITSNRQASAPSSRPGVTDSGWIER